MRGIVLKEDSQSFSWRQSRGAPRECIFLEMLQAKATFHESEVFSTHRARILDEETYAIAGDDRS